jgi:ribosome assembly protein 1
MAPYLINLIDSPGHVDFSMDVCTAARLCDGAIVVVDAVEGVCIQTHAVLRTARREGLRPLLLINKMDRLVAELRLAPSEAYSHVCRIIEAANVVMSSLFASENMERAGNATPSTPASPPSEEGNDASTFDAGAWAVEIDEAVEATLFFDPRRGNVLFASAFDGWAFSLADFALTWAAKTGLTAPALRRALWGDVVWRAKSKKLEAGTGSAAPCAVTMMFEPLWAVYDALQLNPDETRAAKIVSALKLGDRVNQRDMATKDCRARLQAVMRAWLPLPAAVLSAVARVIPSPIEASATRVDRLWPAAAPISKDAASPLPLLSPQMTASERTAHARAAVATCATSADADVVIFISKMFAVPKASLPASATDSAAAAEHADSAWWGLSSDARRAIEAATTSAQAFSTDGDVSPTETFLAFARVFSGVLKPNTPLFLLPPLHDAKSLGAEADAAEADASAPLAHLKCAYSLAHRNLPLFLMMGRDLSPISEAHAGQIIAIGGLSGAVLKTATLSSTPACASLLPMVAQSTPLVRVAVSPKRTSDLAALERGLALLDASDPCVDVACSDSGEWTVAVLGELHLDRAVRDLETRFARVPVAVSAPLLQFSETLADPVELTPAVAAAVAAGAPDGPPSAPEATAASGFRSVHLAGVSVGPTVAVGWARPAAACAAGPGTAAAGPSVYFHAPSSSVIAVTTDRSAFIRARALPLPREALAVLDAAGASSSPSSMAARLSEVLAKAPEPWPGLAARCAALGPKGLGPNALFFCADAEASLAEPALRSAALAGFQLACAAGPLAGEPLWGVAFVVEELEVLEKSRAVPVGMAIVAARDALRLAFEVSSPRVAEALYSCQLTCSGGRGGGGEQLGRCFGVLSKRRARVTAEDMLEGTDTFLISALLPVIESFGFADELRTRTSGAATAPQLIFSHWERLAGDPFGGLPAAEADSGLPKSLVDSVRERKGLPVWTKVLVADGEKQRTRKR